MGIFDLLTGLMELLMQMSLSVSISVVAAIVATPFLIRRVGMFHTFLSHAVAIAMSFGVFFLLAVKDGDPGGEEGMVQGDLLSVGGVIFVSLALQLFLYFLVAKRLSAPKQSESLLDPSLD